MTYYKKLKRKKKTKKYGQGHMQAVKFGKVGGPNSLLRYQRTSWGEMFMPYQMPNSVFAKCVYNCSKLSVTGSSAGTANVLYFRGNGPYDPDTETGGRFPLYWRNWAMLYNKYTCFGSKIKVTFVNNTDTTLNVQNIIYGIVPYVAPGTLPSTVSVLNMQPQCSYKYSKLSTQNITPIIQRYMSTKQIFGISKKKVSDDDALSGYVSSGTPADEWRWAIYTSQPELASGAVTQTILDVKIVYYVRFYDRIEQNVTDSAGITSSPIVFNFPDGPTGDVLH